MPADGATSVAGEMCKSRSLLVFIIKILIVIEMFYGRPLLLGEHVTTRAAVRGSFCRQRGNQENQILAK